MSEPVVAETLVSIVRWIIYTLNSARDTIVRAFVYINLAHHETHEGNRYTYPFVDTDVDIAAPKYILIRTPDTTEQQNLTVSVGSDGVAEGEIFENPTVDVVGSARTPINRNRRSTNTSNVLLYEDPTISLDGLRIAHMDLGGGAVGQLKITGEASIRDEFVLDRNQDYIIKVTVTADNTHINIGPDWYEVTPE